MLLLDRDTTANAAAIATGRTSRLLAMRVLVVLTLVLGVNYVAWRLLFSLNWAAWWIALPLVLAEAYSLIDVSLFGLTMWRSQRRPPPPSAPADVTVDVFITTYNEPADLVAVTARAARDIRYPHSTWILDDGNREELRLVARRLDVGYITRGEDWAGRPLHAKAGNLNNALMATDGEFLLILDADQVPDERILDATLGYFNDSSVALVQTPQVFGNVADGDVLGSHAPLFYGPIQQGKDGWDAAFFCGSNAVLRREALMQLGIVRYAEEVEQAVTVALRGSARVLKSALLAAGSGNGAVHKALSDVAGAIDETRTAIAAGASLSRATYDLQRRVDLVSRSMIADDMALMAEDIRAIGELGTEPGVQWDTLLDVDQTVDMLSERSLSPLGAIHSVQALLASMNVDRSDEAQPLMPLATISVTEDMATSMRLHGLGWSSRYHHETLAVGLAPEDLGTSLKQRLRWAQGTLQVLLRENPLVQKGLTLAQRLMYFSTMWSYLSGFAALAYFAAPVLFLCLGVLPVDTTASEFFLRFLPFMIANQLLFGVAGRGISTWRGQQYSLALFPVWIEATVTALVSVMFRRPLGFAVTSKVRQAGVTWRLVLPQITVSALLVLALVVGLGRLAMGVGEPIGTVVNVAWVVFDLTVMSVLVFAVRYRGYDVGKKH